MSPLRIIALNLALAIAYFAMGKAGLLLALPPGYVTIVWPAAGLAFAACVVWGSWTAWPGVLLGAFVTNLTVGGGFQAGGLAFVIALGSTLQAIVGAFFLRRVDKEAALDNAKAIRLFILVMVPSCLVAPTAGNTALYLFGVLGVDQLPRSFITWWIGDTLGVLIFLPLFLSFFDLRPLWRQRRLQVGIPLLAATMLCGLIYQQVHSDESDRLTGSFSNQADVLLPELIAFGESSTKPVSILAGLAARPENRNAEQFHRIAQVLRQQYPILQSLNWIPFVRQESRHGFEARMSQQLGRSFVVTPLPKHEFHVSGWMAPVVLIEPLAGNEPVLGRDMLSESVRAEAIEKARKTAEMTATAKIILVQDQAGPGGMLIIAPVITDGTIAGVIAGAVNLRSLMKPLLQSRNIEWSLRDLSSNTVVMATLADAPAFAGSHYADHSGIYLRRSFKVADRELQIILHKSYSSFSVPIIPITSLVLIMALLTCAGLVMFMLVVSANAEQTVRETNSRTQQLREEIEQRTQIEQALHASEERFAKAFHSAPIGATIGTFGEGIVIDINQKICELTGYTREEAVGKTTIELGLWSDAAERERMLALILEGGSVRDLPATMRTRSGEIRTLLYSIEKIDLDGKKCLIAQVVDITERKQAEAARAALEAQLHESQKMETMGVLAGGIAHDFNNILAAIRGNTMLAKKDLQARPDDALVSLEEIDKAAKRANDLVQQILIFSRKGVQTFAGQPVRPLVEEAMRLLRSTLPAGVELAAQLADAPLYASVDATQIEHVLINLCTNAYHAMKGDAGRIEVGLTEVLLDQTAAQLSPDLHPGQYVRIRVSDNGEGMDAATQTRIFEPFFTTKGVGLGSGLGLSVVHGIVKAHQGAITVESTPGKGTTFLVYLPAAAAPAEAERGGHRGDAAVAAVDGQGKRVLYVDDDESLVFLVSRMLETAGYQVSGFDRGEAALEAVRADPQAFDLIVTDFNMPGLSGLQVAEELQRIRPELPVVITSGYITDELTASARAVGVSQVVYKPNTVDELCRTIQQLLPVETVRG